MPDALLDSDFFLALKTFLLAMVPVVELRGAIVYGVAKGLSIPLSFLLSIFGNMVPVPFIILFIRRVFEWMKKKPRLQKPILYLERRAHTKGEVVRKYSAIGLCILVAIPLPGTGAWTGALVAAFLNMRLRKALPSISLGVLIAGVIVTLLTYGAAQIF